MDPAAAAPELRVLFDRPFLKY